MAHGLLRSIALGLNLVQSYRDISLALIVAILILSANAAIMVCGLNRYSPDAIQIQGNRTAVTPPSELHPLCSHPMA